MPGGIKETELESINYGAGARLRGRQIGTRVCVYVYAHAHPRTYGTREKFEEVRREQRLVTTFCIPNVRREETRRVG